MKEILSTNYNIKKIVNSKSSILIYGFLIIAVITSIFSAKDTFNFYSNIYENLTNDTSNIIIILLLISTSIKYIKNSNNINYILREKSPKKHINKLIKEIILLNLYIIFHYLILIIAGAIFISYNNYEFIEIKKTNIILIIFIQAIKNISIYIEIVIIVVSLYITHPKNLILLIFIPLLQTIPIYDHNIDNVLKMPINPLKHLNNLNYSNIILEISCSILEIILLTILAKLIINNYNKKKRDLI